MYLKRAFVLSVVLCFVAIPSVQADPTISVGGRLDMDFAKYYEDVTPLNSGSNLRRLRLELGGKLTSKLSFYTLADFNDGTYNAQATWLRYRFNKENELSAGRIETPFSLQRVTNSQFNLFMERALPAALSRHYGTGLVFMHKGSQWNWRLGLFGNDRLNFAGTTQFGTALAGRVGRRLQLGESRIWLGASAMYQDTKQPQRFRARPESSVTDQYLINTGKIFDVGKTGRVGLEGVWKRGQWSVQGEWIHFAGNRSTTDTTKFSGGYFEASRMFNGRRRFNFRRGEWMSPEIGEKGSWELSARISRLDLQDGTITGGLETNFSLGLNYYFNPINRVMLNWIKVDTSSNKRGIDESPSILQLRLQLGF